jgi:hypothetical protein
VIRQFYNYHAWCVLTNRKHRVVTKTFAVEQDRDYVAEALSVNTGGIRVLWQIRLGDGRALFQTAIEIPTHELGPYPRAQQLTPAVVWLAGQTITVEAMLSPEVNIGRRRVGVSLILHGFKAVTRNLQRAATPGRRRKRTKAKENPS